MADQLLFAVALAIGGSAVLLLLPLLLSNLSRRGATREYVEKIFLVIPLAVGFVDPAYGSYAVVAVIAWFGIPRIHRIARADTLEIFVALSAVIVLVSPYWHGTPSDTSRSAAIGAALGVAYFLPVKWVVGTSASQLVKLAQVLVCLGSGLSIVALAGGVSAQIDGTTSARLLVEFANANYASAALATTASLTALLLFRRTPQQPGPPALLLAALCLQVAAIYQFGSRAALAGVVLAVVVTAVFSRNSKVARGVVFVALIVAFVAGWFPKQFAAVVIAASELLAQFGTLARSDEALLTASGRLNLWETSIVAINESPLVGWGPGTYAEIFNLRAVPAHAWGLEYFASVGLLGGTLLAVTVWLAYWGTKKGPLERVSRGPLWNAATAVALLPSLALSTHQWNAWAWMVIALWSCSHILDTDPNDVSLIGRRGEKQVRQNEPQRTAREVAALRGHDQSRR